MRAHRRRTDRPDLAASPRQLLGEAGDDLADQRRAIDRLERDGEVAAGDVRDLEHLFDLVGSTARRRRSSA
ncbi:hypothetical protein [Nannocystis exedens]|uniref:hypothetical protein n=1 Tax=Nannocystis exedens TaxID=54 RepID=UPI000BB9FC85|nr:hypothetical protein [Nannocystis exedens]